MELAGLHHVTAVTRSARKNVDFYTGILGLRLVKKTVNQDDVSAYHLFYADEAGSPGTGLTFFDWSWAGPDPYGSGKISSTALRVDGREALEWWAGRFDELGVKHGEIEDRGGRVALAFADPEGQTLELVDDSETGGLPPGKPPSGTPVPPEKAIRGLYAVSLAVSRIGPTARVLTEVLGFRSAGNYGRDGARTAVFEVGAGGPGAEVHLEVRPGLRPHRMVGAGGVHHVAFRAPDNEHAGWREKLRRSGLAATPVIDRYYFRSIYFREPGGVLFEIATDGPGFAVDEDVERLGGRLSLPPFLEPRREEIEARLEPVG